MLEVPLLTAEECRTLADATVEAASVPGFTPSFSVNDPSTEVPVLDLPAEVCGYHTATAALVVVLLGALSYHTVRPTCQMCCAVLLFP